jgi:ABC-type branched-subunit amino acid transport system substrate-binding protein
MRRATWTLLAAAALLSACAKRVVVDGREYLEDDARLLAAAELDALRTRLAAEPPERAAEALEAFAARQGELPEAAEALLEAGRRWREARRPDRAAGALGRLLAQHPLFPRAIEAKALLGLSQVDEGRTRDGLATLASVYDKVPPAQRLALARPAAVAAERSQAWLLAVRFRSEAARLAPGPEAALELERAVEAVDQLDFLEVARLREELAEDAPVAPALSLKLARVRLHLRDADGAQAESRLLVERWPASPFAAEARALLERLERRVRVQPNVVGVAVPLSGRFKPWGEAILQGVAQGLGEGFRLVVKDTRGEPEGAQVAVEELAVAEGAIAVIGGVSNAEAPRAAKAAQELEVPLLSLAKAERVVEAGPFVFRLMLTAEAQARALAEWAMDSRGMRRFALLYPSVPYGIELANAFWDEVEARGGEMRGAEAYDHDRTTFAPLVKSLVGKLHLDARPDYVEQAKAVAEGERDPFRRRKALDKLREKLAPLTDFDAVFIPDFARNVALVAPALAVEDVFTATCDPRELERVRKATGREDLAPVQLLGANGWDDPVLLERAGRYVECAVFVDGFFAASERPATRQFAQAFQERYGHPPTILEASAHDAARLVRSALEKGARTREALRAALAATRGFPGATGDLSFDERREVRKPLFFLTVDHGAMRELTPAELQTAALPPEPGPRPR